MVFLKEFFEKVDFDYGLRSPNRRKKTHKMFISVIMKYFPGGKELTHCKLSEYFFMFFCQLLTFFKINLFKIFLQEHYQSVKQFGSGSKLFGTTKVSASKERVNIIYLNPFMPNVCSHIY